MEIWGALQWSGASGAANPPDLSHICLQVRPILDYSHLKLTSTISTCTVTISGYGYYDSKHSRRASGRNSWQA